MNVLYLIICLGFLSSQTYNVSGIILDSETSQPIANANVYIENTDYGTTSDKQGYFSLYLKNEFQEDIILNIKMIGYKEEKRQLTLSDSTIDLGKIGLILTSLELESVHIHSHEDDLNQISNIMLGGQELSNITLGTIASTLSNKSSVGVNSLGPVISKPVLRGLSGDRLLLTKDGSEIGDLSQSSLDHVIALDMTEVTQIEVIRGPKSLIYGSNPVGGVINTKISGNPKVRFDRMHNKIMFGRESHNKGMYVKYAFYMPIKDNQFNFIVNYRKTDDQNTSKGLIKNTYSKTLNLKTTFTKYNENGFFNIVYQNYNMDYGVPPIPGGGAVNGVDIELLKNSFQINYHQDISWNIFDQIDIRYDFIDYAHEEYANSSSSFELALAKKTHTLKSEIQSQNLIIGSELEYKKFLPQGLYWTPNVDEVKLSLYSFINKKFNFFDLLSSFRLGSLSMKLNKDRPIYNNNTGLSYMNLDSEEVRDRQFSYFSSSLGLSKKINKFEINAWVMNTMKAPQIEELYSDGPHLAVYSYEIGEPNLDLEKIYGFESSIRYTGEPLTTSITTFYNYSPYYYQMNQRGVCEEVNGELQLQDCLEDEIVQDGVGAAGWLYKYQTKGIKSEIKGLEFNLMYKIKQIQFSYDLSLVRGDDLTNSLPLSYINPTKQILNIDYMRQFANYKIRLSKIHSVDQGRVGEFETSTEGVLLTDIIFSFNYKMHSMTLQLNNIFDKEHYNHLSRIKDIYPEAGRNVHLVYKIMI